MEISKKTLNPSQHTGNLPGRNGAHYSVRLLEKARADTVLKELGSQLSGLSEAEADSCLKQVGTIEIAREKRESAPMRLLGNIKNPLVLLLLALGGKEEEISLKMVVPGDIIRLAAGDMVPADARVLSAKDLFLNQAALTGEALPVEKKAAQAPARQVVYIENTPMFVQIEEGMGIRSILHTDYRSTCAKLALFVLRNDEGVLHETS